MKIVGQYMQTATRPQRRKIIPNKSLNANKGLNVTLSRYPSTPKGLFLPLVCKSTKCKIVQPAMIKGRTK
jgi:hypothetical protein